jgi:hypothetical protein
MRIKETYVVRASVIFLMPSRCSRRKAEQLSAMTLTVASVNRGQEFNCEGVSAKRMTSGPTQ